MWCRVLGERVRLWLNWEGEKPCTGSDLCWVLMHELEPSQMKAKGSAGRSRRLSRRHCCGCRACRENCGLDVGQGRQAWWDHEDEPLPDPAKYPQTNGIPLKSCWQKSDSHFSILKRAGSQESKPREMFQGFYSHLARGDYRVVAVSMGAKETQETFRGKTDVS